MNRPESSHTRPRSTDAVADLRAQPAQLEPHHTATSSPVPSNTPVPNGTLAHAYWRGVLDEAQEQQDGRRQDACDVRDHRVEMQALRAVLEHPQLGLA